MADPLIQKHLDQALHNEKLVSLQLGTQNQEFPDWTITMTFYFAVHRMQAALLKDFNYYPDKHEDDRIERSRNRLVSAHYGAVSRLFMFFYHESRKARYQPNYYQKLDPKMIEKKVHDALTEFGKFP